jgi:hypothetical protein
MSRQHVMMIAESSAIAFLQGEISRPESARAQVSRVRSNRAAATSIKTTDPKAPAGTRWVDRRAMKRAGQPAPSISALSRRSNEPVKGDIR